MSAKTWRALLELLRPMQWIKNFFVLIPLALSQKLFETSAIATSLSAFGIFCLASSGVYVWNDLVDRERDRNHPEKKDRPLSSGRVSVAHAALLSALLMLVSLFLAWRLPPSFFFTLIAYFALNVLYSLWLKHVILIDLFAVSANYVLRIVGGTLVIHEPITSWVIILATLLALFLALGKRRGEYLALQEQAEEHRPTLRAYHPYFLDQLHAVVTSALIMSWVFYTLDPVIQARFHSHWLPLTIPFVLYGLFRYQYLIHVHGRGESPSRTLLADRPLLATVALWFALIVALRFF